MITTNARRTKIILIVLLCVAVHLLLTAMAVIALLPYAQELFFPTPTEPYSAEPEPTLPPPEANPLTAEDFSVDEQGFISCSAVPYSMGIDVSAFQGEIDWQQVKDAGVDFVMIRVGGRGWGEAGTLYADSRAQEYYKGAKEAGLQVGAYFFSQATTVWEALEEAAFTLLLTTGWELELPIVYDWEYVSDQARTAHMDADTLTRCTQAFCRMIEAAGHQPMIYFNQHQGHNLLHLEALTEYPFWLAMYTEGCTYDYRVDYWQYSATGQVPGISTAVDLNLRFHYR